MTTRLLAPLCTCLALATGCGDGTAQNNNSPDLAGERLINGHPFANDPGQSLVAQLDNATNMQTGWWVELWDQQNGCAAAMSPPKNITYLHLVFPLSPVGTYSVNGANVAFISGSDFNAAVPQSGTITCSTFNMQAPMTIAGTYDITFESGEHLAGAFDATRCF